MEKLSLRHESEAFARFGRRKVAPRACVADSKPHIRAFLRDALEELGFITCECGEVSSLRAAVTAHAPDLFVLGLSGGGYIGRSMLDALGRMQYDGKVLIFGPPGSLMTKAVQRAGEDLMLTMLPMLPTPFTEASLHDRTAMMLPQEAPPSPPVDVAEALHSDWLEMWYQPKIDVKTLTIGGAEALIRMRHPAWGIVPPAHFIPDDGDPNFTALSQFVIAQAARDWRYFANEYGNVELSINLPLEFFRNDAAVAALARDLPRHPAFTGMLVEFNASDIVRDLPLARQAADQLRMLNIGVSIDDLGEEWPLLTEIDDCPFVEIKVDRSFVTGCGDDRLKQSTCRRILELADRFGVRTVAEGVETRADFIAVRELGFELIQGFFFAKPMEARKLARRLLGRQIELPR